MPTILLVDDQQPFRESLAEALEDHGFDVLQAGDASEALGLCASRPRRPDLFLLDIALPGPSGIELLETLRSRFGAYRVPALFLTAHPRGSYLEESRRLGASDFFVKSDVSLRDLLKRIEHRLEPSPGGSSVHPRTTFRPALEDEDAEEARQHHLRPALRRWKPSSPRPSVARLFTAALRDPVGLDDILPVTDLDGELATLLREAATSGPFRSKPAPRRIEDSIARLGPDDAMRLLLSRSVIDLAGKGVPPRGDLVRLWGHALATGIFAEHLAPAGIFPSRHAAFLAGFCSELPSVFGILALEEEYAQARAQAWEETAPIQVFLADIFETTPAHIALECCRALELPESVWKPVVDLQAEFAPTSLWEPGPASRILDAASQLSLGLNHFWNPCVRIRAIAPEEARWWREPGKLQEDLPVLSANIDRLLLWEDVLPELGGQTQAIPVGEDRRILYLRGAGTIHPDPIESLLRRLGDVTLVERPEDLDGEEEAVRVAVAEPGTAQWERLLEIPRRTVLLHRGILPPDARTGPHAGLYLPATAAAIESALRPR